MSAPSPQRKVQVWVYGWTGPRRPEREGAPSAVLSSLRILLLKTIPKRDSFWQPVTGKVEQGESWTDAALREAQEETHLKFVSPPFDLSFEFEFNGRWGRAKERVFALEVRLKQEKNLPNVLIDPSEHDDYEWLTYDEAYARLRFDSNRHGLKVLLEQIKKDLR